MRTLKTILDNLSDPVPSDYLSQKPVYSKGQKKGLVDYIAWYDLSDLLDQRCGLTGWEWSQTVTQVGNRVIVEGKLTVIGEDGQLSRSSQGNEEIDANIPYGDCVCNAEAMAMRRCCAKFGLGRDLWRKDETKQPSLPNISQSVPKGQITREEWLKRKNKPELPPHTYAETYD